MEPTPSWPVPWPEPAPAAILPPPRHCTGRGIHSPNPPLLGFMPFLLFHPCLLYTHSRIYILYFNLPLGSSQILAKPRRATPLTSGNIRDGS